MLTAAAFVAFARAEADHLVIEAGLGGRYDATNVLDDAIVVLENIYAKIESGMPPIAAGVDVSALNFRYAIQGDTPAWRPLRAFDDGRQVFIEFPRGIGQGEMPPLFVVGPDGNTSELVNYRVRGNYMIVDRLFAAAELRFGADRNQKRVRISRTDGRPAS